VTSTKQNGCLLGCSSALKMEAVCSSKMSVSVCWTIWCHMAGDGYSVRFVLFAIFVVLVYKISMWDILGGGAGM
jgi:hypothetical protein